MKRMDVDKVTRDLCIITRTPLNKYENNSDLSEVPDYLNIVMLTSTLMSFGGHDYSTGEISNIFTCQSIIGLYNANDPAAAIRKQMLDAGIFVDDDYKDIVDDMGKYIVDHRNEDDFIRMINEFKEYIDQFKYDLKEGAAVMDRLGMVSHISDAPSSMYI